MNIIKPKKHTFWRRLACLLRGHHRIPMAPIYSRSLEGERRFVTDYWFCKRCSDHGVGPTP